MSELFIFPKAFQPLKQEKHFNESLYPTSKYGKFAQKYIHHNLENICLK